MCHGKTKMNRLLFLCTGNYYRSRFAAALFNSLATRCRLVWRADSRGLALEFAGGNIGPMSSVAIATLEAKGVDCPSTKRFPKAVSEVDFQGANLIIALDELEHRPMMRERFPEWENKIVYWLVHDLDQWDAETALASIETLVSRLVEELRGN